MRAAFLKLCGIDSSDVTGILEALHAGFALESGQESLDQIADPDKKNDEMLSGLPQAACVRFRCSPSIRKWLSY